VTILSLGFLFLFIAFNSAANISAQALENNGFNGLGFYTMAILYLVYSIGSFFSSYFVNKIGDKASLFLSGLCYAFWIFGFIPAAFYPDNKDSSLFIFNRSFIIFLSLFSAAVNGLGSSVLWVAQGKFPKPITLSPTIKVWRNQSLLDWIDGQTKKSTWDDKCGK
jgi:predicted DNA-binding transcriptional regulator AlpA